MDYIRTDHPEPPMHPALRNAVEALGTALTITLGVTFAVNWALRNFGYSSELADTLLEAQRWFLPMFAYLFTLFWMIDSGQR